MSGYYMNYLAGLCQRRSWSDPLYETYKSPHGYTCLVLVNGRGYQTDLAYESDVLAQENAAMRAFMVCRNFSVNGGMLARNGVIQGLPVDLEERERRGKSRRTGSGSSSYHGHKSRRDGRAGSGSSASSSSSSHK